MLERIWRENYAILRSIVRNVLIDSAAVEDILQESFAKLLRAGRSFPNEQETYKYVRRVVLNTSIDHYRARKRRRVRLREDPDVAERAVSSEPGPLSALLRDERARLQASVWEQIQQVLMELPTRQREAIELLFDRGDESLKDLCRERDIPYSTLRSRAAAGLERIRKRLKARGLYQVFSEVKFR